MKIPQLSVFLENKLGRLTSPCKALAEKNINILTMSLADTEQFGILRLIVQDWQTAKKVLEEKGCVVNMTEVVAIEVEDRPGGLAHVLDIIEQTHTNVEYTYAFTFGCGNKAVLIFRFEDPDKAIVNLREKGLNVIAGGDLYERGQR